MSRPPRESAGQIIRRRGGSIVEGEVGEKSRGGGSTKKDVKNEDRTDYVYENKETYDNLPETRDDISTQLHDILQKSTGILQKPSAFCHYLSAAKRTPHSQI